MRLAALQRTFWSMACERVHDAEQHFVSTAALSAADRLGIYADMFLWRQVDCLREDFPKLAALHEDFFALAQAYLASHPSRHPSLARLGSHFSAFLADRTGERSDLADLAALEWARAEVFEEADAPILTQPTSLEGSLHLVPALRILNLAHDAAALWESHAAEASRAPCTVVVWRKDYEVFHVRLCEAEAHALACAARGEPIENVCAAFEDESEPLQAALRALGSWFVEGWIADPGEG